MAKSVDKKGQIRALNFILKLRKFRLGSDVIHVV